MSSVATYAVDTSVAVPLLIGSHPQNIPLTQWAQDKTLHLCGHAFFETYSVLTRLPKTSRVAPHDAIALMEAGFAPPLMVDNDIASTLPQLFAQRGVHGGATWDALVAMAALRFDLTLVTRDARALATYDALSVPTVIIKDS